MSDPISNIPPILHRAPVKGGTCPQCKRPSGVSLLTGRPRSVCLDCQTRERDPISNITRTGSGEQVAYDITFTCGHTREGCGNGSGHLAADRERALKGPCYDCHCAARRAAQRGDYRPLVTVETEGTQRLVAAICTSEGVAA